MAPRAWALANHGREPRERANQAVGSSAMSRYAQITHVLLRIVAGFLLMQHGGQKLFGWYGGLGGPGGGGSLPPLMMVAGVLEFFGGLAVMLGLFTRPIAFVLSGEMAF